jgi:hypothetical protein
MRLFALLSVLLAAAPASVHTAAPGRAAASASPAALTPDELFSRRALRRARLLIQMRLMQLRDERLECVREALLRQLPEALRPETPSPSRGGDAGAAAKCAEAPGVPTC